MLTRISHTTADVEKNASASGCGSCSCEAAATTSINTHLLILGKELIEHSINFSFPPFYEHYIRMNVVHPLYCSRPVRAIGFANCVTGKQVWESCFAGFLGVPLRGTPSPASHHNPPANAIVGQKVRRRKTNGASWLSP